MVEREGWHMTRDKSSTPCLQSLLPGMMATTTTTATLSWSFLCGLRGFHVYRNVWTPVMDEVLSTIHESHNSYDCYAIAAKKQFPGHLTSTTVGHLPKEISRFTHFIMFYGATVTAKVVDAHHRRSPLVQGGLEIPVLITVEMNYTSQNKEALSRYEKLVTISYEQPVDGKFQDITATILKDLDNSSDEDENTA